MDQLSTLLAAVEGSQTAKNNAIAQGQNDQGKLVAIQAALAQDATTIVASAAQADSDVNAAIAYLQSILSTAAPATPAAPAAPAS